MPYENRASGGRELPGIHHGSSVHYAIDAATRQVTVDFGKRVTVEDIAAYSAQLKSDPVFDPMMGEIIDLRAAEEVALQAGDFLKLADEIDPFLPEAKRAFVVQTSTQRHAARMHKVLRTQSNIKVFHSMEDAQRWIHSHE